VNRGKEMQRLASSPAASGIDAPVGLAGNQVPGGAAGGVPGLAPGDDALFQQGDDPVGDQVVDFLAHVVSPLLM